MIKPQGDILPDHLDTDLLVPAIRALRAAGGESCAVYSLTGAALWRDGGQLPESTAKHAPLADACARAQEERGAVWVKDEGAPLIVSPLVMPVGVVGFFAVSAKAGAPEDALPRLEAVLELSRFFLAECVSASRAGDDLASELTESFEELALLHEMSRSMDLSQPAEKSIETICNALIETLQAQLLILSVPTLNTLAVYPPDPSRQQDFESLARRLLKRVLKRGKTFAVNFVEDSELLGDMAAKLPYSNVACVPIDVDGATGMVALMRGGEEGRLHMSHVKMLETVSKQIAVSLANRKVLAAREELFAATIFGLARLAESRDNETGEHLKRVSWYCRILATFCMMKGVFPELIDQAFIEGIFISSPLHDIGKVGIPDAILNKPGKLTEEEFDLMKTHATIGGDTLRDIEKELDWGESTFLTMGRDIAYAHHEKWNGSGYPNRLAGEAIPVAARIMAIADVYDALTSKRCYKDAFPHEKATEIICDGRDTHFQGVLLDVFLLCQEQFKGVRNSYSG